jgi:hypothetical protein
MGSNNKDNKKPAGAAQPRGDEPPKGGGAPVAPVTDTRLLNFVRQNSHRICGSLTLAAAQAATAQNWTEMQEYTQLSNQLGTLTGITQQPALAAAAGAGRT